MTKLYLIRHAEAEGNLYRIAQGQYNSAITEHGYRQIQALARRFAEIPVDAVYASDLYRTCATASAIYKPKGLPLHRRADLREICVGEWEQKTWGEIAKTYPQELENFSHYLHRWNVPGAEQPQAVLQRMRRAVREIVAENPGKTVAIVSHGCALRILLADIQGYSLEQLGQTPLGSNTAVSLVEAEGDALRVIFRDDVSHLKGIQPIPARRTGVPGGGFCFQQLQLPEQAEFLADCVHAAWREAGASRPWNADMLLQDARQRPTLIGMLEEQPAAVIQFHPTKEAAEGCGWISLYCLTPSYQRHRLGVQLLGQAVTYYRPLGRERLRIALRDGENGTRDFFTAHGFVPVGQADSGRKIFEKNIGYRQEFLGE